MVREEIVAGLRNAIERGQSIQQAMQSMANAGYQTNEIQEASKYVNLGATGLMQQAPKAYVSQEQYSPNPENPTLPEKQNPITKPSTSKTKVIILSLFLILLLAGLGVMIYFMLKP